MYELLLFTGGVYKFDEFVEFIDDIGGLVIEMESFKFNRGMYFLSEEVRVLIIVPEEDKPEIESLAHEIKGTVEPVLMEDGEIEKVVLIFEIYKKIVTDETMTTKNIMEHLSNDPDLINIKNSNPENFSNQINDLEKINELLTLMEKMSLIEKIENEKSLVYKIKKHD